MGDALSRAALETFWYFAFGGPATAVASGLLLLACSPALLRLSPRRRAVFVRHALVFATILFVCGAPANAAFTLLARDRLYFAADPIVDWLPWLPSGDWVLDIPCGGRYLAGASVWTLRLSWLALAVPVWLLSVVIYRSLVVRLQRQP